MNAKQLIAAVAVLAATGSAFAQSKESVAPDANFMSSKSRAEVIAELNQAQAQGVLAIREDTYPVIKKQAAMRSRADVRAEAIQSARGNMLQSDIYFGA
jgi:hypothetical protein